jgi:hypothetical protein
MDDVMLDLPVGSVLLRRATIDDLSAIIDLLADDPISAARGDSADAGDREAYEVAFAAIDGIPLSGCSSSSIRLSCRTLSSGRTLSSAGTLSSARCSSP